MKKITNPYRAGAGLMPVYLAGRNQELEDVDMMFQALLVNIPVKSIIYSGLRGVGKTVLLNALYKNAVSYNIFCKYIEVENRQDFISQIVSCGQSFVREASLTGKVSYMINKAIDALKSLSVSFDQYNNTFELSIKDDFLYKSNNLTQSLTETFISMGEIASELHKPICFFVDEIQYMKKEELGALISALHRSNQLGYPLMMIGAGLPKIYKMLAEEKSYSERLFRYKQIGSLCEEDAKTAIIEPAKHFAVTYTEEALENIIALTKGYPFFVQQFCQIIYDNVDNKIITGIDVNNSVNDYLQELDYGFFKVRYDRCSEQEKKFIFAMVCCEELPCSIGNIAKNMRKSTSQISPIRAKLIDKGIIFSVKYKELDFTVPEFSNFVQRKEEYYDWLKERK